MAYTNFGEKRIDFSNSNEVIDSYNEGYVFTRSEKGLMKRVRSLRINLKNFETSSENRRILKKFNHEINISKIPFENYSWEIHKLGKDFYDQKFGEGTFSANKVKELFTTGVNFNSIITFKNLETNRIDGYCIAYFSDDNNIAHYAYPFYNLDLINTSFGMYMMTKTAEYAKSNNYNYLYLGSVHEKAALYKLQFKGLEWWDETNNNWSTDLEMLKNRILTLLAQ